MSLDFDYAEEWGIVDSFDLEEDADSSSASLGSLSPVSYERNLEPMKKKRFRPNRKRYRASLFPRVLKRDIRRLFPQMLTNILNSCEANLLASFFATYAVPSWSYAANYTDDSVIRKPDLGIEDKAMEMSTSLIIQHEIVPDLTATLSSSFIKQYRGESRSTVVCNLVCTGTKVFEYSKPEGVTIDAEQNAILKIDQYLQEFYPVAVAVLCLDDFDSCTPPISKIGSTRLVRSPRPFRFRTRCSISLDFDEFNRISGLTYIGVVN